MPGLPPLAALRAFAAYVETGSVTKAGARLNVSHAAISQQMRNLESHLGLALFDRSGRALVLTDEGAALAQAVTTGFATIATAVAQLTGAEADRPLQITTTPSFAANWFMPRLAAFRARAPEIDIMVDASPALRDPGQDGIDAAIRYGDGGWPGLDSTFLWPSSVVLVGAPSLLDGRGPDDPRAFADLPWLQELGSSESTEWLRLRRGPDVQVRGVTRVPGNLMLDGARNGQGLAMTTRIAVEADIAAGRLQVLFEEPPGKGYHLVTARGIHRPPLRVFLAWIREAARDWAAECHTQ
jgi:LysR family glycine cleavage system transcriptional activator